MEETNEIKIIFDAASYYMGNLLIYDLNPQLEHKPGLKDLLIWTAANVFIRYDIIEWLKEKKIILTNDDIYFSLGIMATSVNLFFSKIIQNRPDSFYKILKVNLVGTMSNILMSRIIKYKK